MDFIRNCFEQNNDAFSKKLVQVGFAADRTKPFLFETASAVSNIIENGKLEKTIEVLLSDHPAQLLKAIDPHTLSKKLHINSEQVASGLEAISPEMAQFFSLNINEVIAATASLAWKSSDASFEKKSNLLACVD